MYCNICQQETHLVKEISICVNFSSFHCENSINVCADCEEKAMNILMKPVLYFDSFMRESIAEGEKRV